MEDSKKKLVKLVIGIIAFAVSFLFQKNIHIIILAFAYVVLGFEVVKEAFDGLFHGEFFNENFLMTIATIAAFILKDYNEAVFVMLFYDVGEFAQDAATGKSRKNIKELIDLTPQYVHVGEENIDPHDIEVGMVFTVFPGERVPIDGNVVSGKSFINTKAITGENKPFEVRENSTVISGSIVLDSTLKIKAEKKYSESTVSRIMSLIEKNNESKSKTETFINRFARVYTPVIVFSAVALAVIPSLIIGSWNEWIHRSLTFLVISCPCALVLSIPLAFFAGIGSCASKGILVKGSEHLEKLAKTEVVVFDKTGTLTKGEFEVQKVYCLDMLQEKRMLEILYALEKNSRHPIARAVDKYCSEKHIKMLHATDSKEEAGLGIVGIINGKTAIAGNDKLLRNNGIVFKSSINSGSTVYVAYDGKFLGFVVISDVIKNGVKDCIIDLKKLGIKKTVMLSGDNRESSETVAKELNLDECFYSLLPQEKSEKMKRLKESYICTYCGDGINDIPVMLEANTAISMGNIGSDAAVEASGIVFANDSLNNLPTAIKKSRKTVRIAKENITFALVCKLTCLALSSLGITGLGLAIFADTGVALLAVLNSMRALN